MKFITLKNYKKNLSYTVKVEGDVVLIYVFDSVKKGFVRCLHINRPWLLKKLLKLS